ncbi:hypothetical protein BWQ96_09429 [Gracilariopsis chorda]|uniref:Uncharacterized protein n=1 Tax=Gracilariopsis chorda TaxID=448386 RepID=A0A2V3IFG6_9FLOR|nr:hypothetical protein BWQ96_09429 [Gracilariopsis chorda]|eukprot:PXF40839.1 hypothetical protein BWQ96_09429 [Gracilariopsis chorda]
MGIKATVVYDAPRHTVVVLRTESNNVTDRYSILETVSSFTQHCDSLRGVANTVTQVSALWGGPPYIEYTVVGSRFRVIVVWDEETAQFDISYDVHNAMKRLESAVFNVAEALEARSVDAVATVYEAAGYALHGDFPPNFREGKPSKAKNLSISSSRRSSVTNEPKKKKSLFGRIGSALKSSSDSVKKNVRQEALSTAPSEASPSAALFGSQAALDSSAGDLQLPGTVFKWTDFAPLQSEESDLKWFVDLVRGQGVQEVGADLPKLRGNVSTQLIFLATDSANPDTRAVSLVPSKDRPGSTLLQTPLSHSIHVESPESMAVQSNTTATTKTASVVVQSVNSTPQTGSISGKKSTGMGVSSAQASNEQKNTNSDPSSVRINPHGNSTPSKGEGFAVESLGSVKDNASVPSSSNQQEQDLAIRSHMNEFARSMQTGDFTTALQQVSSTLNFLSTVNPRRERETVTCAHYFLATKILCRNSALERELSAVVPDSAEAVRKHIESGLLTMFLAELKNLLPRHRVAAMQLAIEKNGIVGNYDSYISLWKMLSLPSCVPRCIRWCVARTVMWCMLRGYSPPYGIRQDTASSIRRHNNYLRY